MATNRLPAASRLLHDIPTINLEIGARPQAACGSILTLGNITHIYNMKHKTVTLMVVCSAAIVFAGCATGQRPTAWDYKVIREYNGPLEPQIQKAAAEGWEVVSSGGGDQNPLVILRRPK